MTMQTLTLDGREYVIIAKSETRPVPDFSKT